MDRSDIILKKDLIKAIFSPKSRKKNRSRKVNTVFNKTDTRPDKERKPDA